MTNRTATHSASSGVKRSGESLLGACIPVAVVFFALLMRAEPAAAQIYSTGSNSGGAAWTSPSTWQGGVVPDSTQNVVIVTGDSIYTSPTSGVSCDNIEVQSGAVLSILGSSSGGGITVKGSFTMDAGSWFYNGYTSETGWPSNATSYSIDPTSNYVLMSAGSSTFGSNTADSTFGNVYVLKSGTSGAANLTILGNLYINTGGSGNTFRGISAGTADGPDGPSLVHHVKGNVYVISGQWSCVDGDLGTGQAMTCIWNIDGNVTLGDSSTAKSQARMGPFTSSNSNEKYGIFNIGGNLSVINGGRLQCGSSSSDLATTEVGEINLKGNLTLDKTAAVSGNTSGSFAINFVGNKTQTVSLGVPIKYSPNSGGAYPTLCDTVATGANVAFTGGSPWGVVGGTPTQPANGWGGWIVNGTLMLTSADTIVGNQSFTVQKGGTLGIGSADGITATSAKGNIEVTGTRMYSSEASYTYDGFLAQTTGDGLPATVNNLTISNSGGVSLMGNVAVAGELTLSDGGKLSTGSQTLTVSNSSPSAVVGDSASYVIGSLIRAQGTTTGAYLFPIGTATDYRGVTVNFTAAPSSASNLTASFTATDPTSVSLPTGISGYWNGGYWTIASSGTPGGTYDMMLYAKGVPGIDTGSVTILQKALLINPWLAAGTSSSVSGNVVTENGVSNLGIFGIGYGTITGVLSRVNGVPTRIALSNFPNPFNPTTQIQFAVPKNARVALVVYNVLGQKVATLVDQNMSAGVYQRVFDGSRYASGMYFARLSVGNQVVVNKMLMLK